MASSSIAAKLKAPRLLTSVAFINGVFKPLTAEMPRLAVINPATGAVEGHVPNLGQADTQAAIQAAQAAQSSWAASTPTRRAQVLRQWAALMQEHSNDLAAIMTMEAGKPLGESRGENAYSTGYVDWFAGEAERVCGDIVASPRAGVRSLVLKQPVGVVGIITPWNFPSAMITRSAAAAMAAGCTVVIKPSELTPFSAGALALLAHEAGVPAGVFNVVTGEAKPIGDALMQSDVVRKLCFTGSTATGKHLYQQAAGTVKKLSLELGGNAPFIVFEDADLVAAANGAIASKFRNAGQTCVCANRIFVHESVEEKFLDIFSKKVAALKLGNGADADVNIGPLISERACSNVEAMFKDAMDRGARCVVGGKRPADAGSRHFFEPTVLSVVHPASRVLQEEIFGPLAPVVSFKSEQEVIERSNQVPVGLASYVFTNDYRRQWRMMEQLKFGMVGINEGVISSNIAPFGGVKQSGLGRDGSKYGIEGFLDIKYACLGGGI